MAVDDEGLDSPLIAELFGRLASDLADGSGGAVVFFDALPLPDYRLKLDIMNPHHGEYYTGNEWPTDWQSPTPIPFLAVERGSEFELMLATRTGRGLDRVGKWLRAALGGGLGAKISAGYGRFEVLDVAS